MKSFLFDAGASVLSAKVTAVILPVDSSAKVAIFNMGFLLLYRLGLKIIDKIAEKKKLNIDSNSINSEVNEIAKDVKTVADLAGSKPISQTAEIVAELTNEANTISEKKE